jgi:acetylornithine/LysW-gamma-L-lysine aminotransferase
LQHSLRDFNEILQRVSITRGENDLLFDAAGDRYIDLLSGGGTTFLGHANPAIVAAVRSQLDRVWTTGQIRTPVYRAAKENVEALFPPEYRVACFYSTGMEANEFALRVARVATGRSGIIGFERAMHGKSLGTASLGWPNPLVALPDQHSLPYLARLGEDEVLAGVERLLATRSIAAVFNEPLAGSGGGYLATPAFARRLAELCKQYGTLLVIDEIFTGLYRTGDVFLHRSLGIEPDILLTGKTMGNGFPVSAVVVRERYPIEGAMLPNSTYSDNALAAAAVVATLHEMSRLDLPAKVAEIERVITGALSAVGELGIALRGKGALWVLEPPPRMSTWSVGQRLLRQRVVASVTAQYIRILPAATISLERLAEACDIVLEAFRQEHEAGGLQGVRPGSD